MARYTINNKHGQPTNYFWSDKHAVNPERVTVFKQTSDGVKKMTGVSFDSNKGRIVKG
jgi:hypothetical protein